ncbi:hypothetical protein D3C85_1415850 [compost metagenome]
MTPGDGNGTVAPAERWLTSAASFRCNWPVPRQSNTCVCGIRKSCIIICGLRTPFHSLIESSPSTSTRAEGAISAAKLPLPKPTASTEQLTSSFAWDNPSFRCCFSFPIVRISARSNSVNMNFGDGLPIPKGASCSRLSILASGTSAKLHALSTRNIGI